MRLTLILATTLVGLTGAVSAPAARAQTYDAVLDFSATVPQTNAAIWTYRYKTTPARNGKYKLEPINVSDSNWTSNGKPVELFFWQGPEGGYPYITANQTNRMLTRNYCCGPIFAPKRSMIIDEGSALAVVTFRAPKSGKVRVRYSFTHLDCHGGNGIRYFVDLNSGQQGNLASGTLDTASCESPDSSGLQTLNLRVRRHDQIHFIIDNNGDLNFDTSAMTAVVTYK